MNDVMRKPVYATYANNKCADQPVHPRSLISAFVVRCLDSIISLVSIHASEISSLYLASVAAQAGLSLTWSQTPKTGFLVTRLKYEELNMIMCSVPCLFNLGICDGSHKCITGEGCCSVKPV